MCVDMCARACVHVCEAVSVVRGVEREDQSGSESEL